MHPDLSKHSPVFPPSFPLCCLSLCSLSSLCSPGLVWYHACMHHGPANKLHRVATPLPLSLSCQVEPLKHSLSSPLHFYPSIHPSIPPSPLPVPPPPPSLPGMLLCLLILVCPIPPFPLPAHPSGLQEWSPSPLSFPSIHPSISSQPSILQHSMHFWDVLEPLKSQEHSEAFPFQTVKIPLLSGCHVRRVSASSFCRGTKGGLSFGVAWSRI